MHILYIVLLVLGQKNVSHQKIQNLMQASDLFFLVSGMDFKL